MVDQLKSFLRDNHTLVIFLVVQAIAIVAYSVKLETRVSTMETRGAEYSVARMAKMEERITVLEQDSKKHTSQLERIVDLLTKK
jgi:predicted negative regulator of RcsB-dependent stress response